MEYINHGRASIVVADIPAPFPLTLFRSNSKFNQNLPCSGLKYTLPITTKFCTRHDSVELSWRGQNFFVIGWAHFTSKFWSNFEFVRKNISGTGAWCLSDTMASATVMMTWVSRHIFQERTHVMNIKIRPSQNYEKERCCTFDIKISEVAKHGSWRYYDRTEVVVFSSQHICKFQPLYFSSIGRSHATLHTMD